MYSTFDEFAAFLEAFGQPIVIEGAGANRERREVTIVEIRYTAEFSDEILRAMTTFDEFLSLQALLISETGLTNEGAKYLLHFPRLEYLDIKSTAVGDVAVTWIRECKSLMCLEIEETSVSDVGLREIATLPNLEMLNIKQTRVTDEGCSFLAGHARLGALYLQRCAVTNQCVTAIAGIPHLRSVNLWNTGVDSAGVRKLHALRPDVRIEHPAASTLN